MNDSVLARQNSAGFPDRDRVRLGILRELLKYKSVSDYPVSDEERPEFRKIGRTSKGKENENVVTVSIGNPFGQVIGKRTLGCIDRPRASSSHAVIADPDPDDRLATSD